MTNEIQRRYRLTRIRAGDYLLPSNDAKTIWRIHRYEDGPSFGLDWPRDLAFWALRKWSGSVGESAHVDIEDWDRWALWDDMFDTRAEAIQAALKAGRLTGERV